MTEVQRLQAQQADAALEEFKRQVEVNSEKVYGEMKEQVRHKTHTHSTPEAFHFLKSFVVPERWLIS